MKVDAFVIVPHSKNKGTEVELEIAPLTVCRECKFGQRISENFYDCDRIDFTYVNEGEWFCAAGKRKDDSDD